MSNHIAGIDHVLVGVRDLEGACATFARLGFTATPRGRHHGWGTGNYCLMFERDYVELLGVVDPGQFLNGLDHLLEEREGLLGLALASGDPEATHAAWRTAGLASAELRELARRLESDGAAPLLRFRNVMLDRAETAGLGLFACGHLTPEAMRRPAWLGHRNGALAIASVTVLAEEPEALAPALGRVFGPTRLTSTDRIIAVHTGRGVILVAGEDDLDMLHPELEPIATAKGPVLAALSIVVEDPERAAALLDAAGVPFSRDRSGAVGIAPRHAHGVMLELLPPSAAP